MLELFKKGLLISFSRKKQNKAGDAPVMNDSSDEDTRRPTKFNPKHKSHEFVADDSSSDSDFNKTEEPKKLNSSRYAKSDIKLYDWYIMK